MHRNISINLHLIILMIISHKKMFHLRSDEIINEKRWKEIELSRWHHALFCDYCLRFFFIVLCFRTNDDDNDECLDDIETRKWICKVFIFNHKEAFYGYLKIINISIKFMFLSKLTTLSHYCVFTLFSLKAVNSCEFININKDEAYCWNLLLSIFSKLFYSYFEFDFFSAIYDNF